MNIKANSVVIIGAGLAGTMMAVMLARKGVQHIVVLERQKEQLVEGLGNGRSFNLTISKRGETALKNVELLDEVLEKTLPVTGRMCHIAGEPDRFFAYGDTDKHVLHSIRRSAMNSTLLNAARRYPQISFEFDVQVKSIDKTTGSITAIKNETGEALDLLNADFIIGADGAFSAARSSLLAGERTDYSQTFLPWSYREINIPIGAMGKPLLNTNSLHVWPRGDVMMFALPNPDGSFTGNFIYPLERENDFFDNGYITKYFHKHLPDLAPLLPGIEEKLKSTPPSNFLTIRTQKWHHDGKVVLIGDAAHGIIPFYGQGMNSSFDDCQALISALENHGDDYNAAFREFKEIRKPNTDIIADLSISNFEELRSGFRGARNQAKRRLDNQLFRFLPNIWIPVHILISHTDMSYVEATTQYKRREGIARMMGLDILISGMLLAGLLARFNNSVVALFRGSIPNFVKSVFKNV